MTTDRMLSDVLEHEADLHDPPCLDPSAIASAARAHRRNRVALAVAATAAVVVGTSLAVAGLRATPAPDTPDTSLLPQHSLERTVVTADPQAPTIPYCEPAVSEASEDVLHVAGHAYATPCAYWNPGHRYLWYHLGRLVMSAPDGLFEFRDERWVEYAKTVHAGLRISVDGRRLAWFEGGALVVHDLAADPPVTRSALPAALNGAGASSVEGVDAEGRVYVRAGDGALWMKGADPAAALVPLHGLPAERVLDPDRGVSYITPDGLAVLVRDVSPQDPVPSSVEGRVTDDARFVPVRTVPLGRAVWSTDRSRAVQLTGEGFTVQPADAGSEPGRLDIPLPPGGAATVGWDAQWESRWSVVVTTVEVVDHASDPTSAVVYRCSMPNDGCRPLPRGYSIPLSAGAHPGG